MDADNCIMKYSTLILFVLVLSGCASSDFEDRPKPFQGPNGRDAYTLECRNQASCYRDASGLCAKGYDIIESDKKLSGIVNFGGGPLAVHKNTLFIECK